MPSLFHPDPNELVIFQFEEKTRSAAQIQLDVLHDILQHNARTEYLQNCGLNGRTDLADFKQCVPLVTHSELQPYFRRIADGDKSPILTADPILALSLSSGTTSDGQQKYLLLYNEILQASLQFGKINSAYRARAFPTRPGGRIFALLFCGKLSKTKGGLVSGTATTHMFKSNEFKMNQRSAGLRACSPEEVVNGSDNRQAMYCHLLCALLYREDVECITSTFAYSLVEAFRTFELQWKHLCDDIRLGELSDWITDPDIRSAMKEILKPDPELANKLIQICSGLDNWYGLIPQIWPNCKYIHSIMTGSMETYVKKLRHYGAKLPLVGGDYGATEAWIAVNADPKADPRDVSFTVVPDFVYFEFIPLIRKHADPNDICDCQSTGVYEEKDPVGLTEVKVGQEYEVVITTHGGLYRYRLGDIVRVTGFLNSSPKLAYVCRKNVLLTINIDKNTEKDLQLAVEKGAKFLAPYGVELIDFTSHAELSSSPAGHYVIFLELSNYTSLDEKILQQCASIMDASFVDPGYIGSRKGHAIGPLELCIVRPGTFRFLLNRYLKKGTAISQYKTPRCIASEELHNILRSSVSFSTLSLAYD